MLLREKDDKKAKVYKDRKPYICMAKIVVVKTDIDFTYMVYQELFEKINKCVEEDTDVVVKVPFDVDIDIQSFDL
jgi:hypothetical protein